MDFSVYLEKMSEFARILRHEGLAVGLSETADACTVLTMMDLSDKASVKAALRTVFAKSQPEQAVFDRCFDGWFISAEAKIAQREQVRQEQEELARQKQQAEEDLQYRGEPMDLREDLKDTYARMPEAERERLRQLMERYKGNIDRQPELYGNFIHSVFMRALLEQQMALEDAALGVDSFDDPELELMFRDISMFREEEIPRAISLIGKITQQFNHEINSRRQSRGHSGKLDFRRTIRNALQTGGSFHRLAWKKRRKHKKRLVLLCDVSGSMLQFSEFALHFIPSMAEVSDASRVFLFSEQTVEVDAFNLKNMDGFRDYVKSTGLFGRGTDLSQALQTLLSKRPSPLGPAVTLMILSDTKTVNVAQAEALLTAARRNCSEVLWLNPIPQRKWPYIRSVQTMSALCRMIPCSTLDELARSCRRLMKL
ncbi:MAG: VWA domain-containing protein [Oscillospiraceae bacterium]|nr:VWA domain-containing protein [Oscillospiraceae bacterium]